ncbi:MAG: hypothetical protein LBM94_04910 [Propionibacteriaceae bacterium]|jgi:hypothetical protein|nr:hypothetical protein [Propionibacteriaceae bacterium]
MSLFGSIVGNIVGNRVQRAVGNKVGDIIGDKIDDAIGVSGRPQTTQGTVGYDIEGRPISGPVTVPRPGGYSTPSRDEPTKNRAWFANVLATSFAGHTVRDNVSPSEFGGPGNAKAYDFVVYSGATPKAAIILATNNRSEAYKAARATAEGSGIAFLPFWLTMWNKQDYVVNRISAAL